MSVSSSKIANTESSEKSFGVLFSIVFLLISLYPLTKSLPIHIWALLLSIMFICLAFLAPKTMIVPKKIWLNFGLLLGSIIAPIVMALIYFSVILITGVIMRALGKDLLRLKPNKKNKSYWIRRSEDIGPMKNQF
jgi:membrane-associated HD superfamily phosphohydrolase